MSAVLAGNLITAMILFGFIRRYLQDKQGKEDDDPFLTLGPILFGFAMLGFGFFFYSTSS